MLQKIERKPRQFNALKIPKSLQEALPFKSKPKDQKKRNKPLLETKRAVLMEPHERQVVTLVNQLSLIRTEKVLSHRLVLSENICLAQKYFFTSLCSAFLSICVVYHLLVHFDHTIITWQIVLSSDMLC